MEFLLYLLLLLNLITSLVFGLDKWFAIKNKQRISEKNLLLLSFFGGSLGAILAMLLFRHKIAKSSFLWKFVVIVVLQLASIYGFFEIFIKKAV